jgi:hypothetical protein
MVQAVKYDVTLVEALGKYGVQLDEVLFFVDCSCIADSERPFLNWSL